jgi:rare lipoprotein A
VQTAKPYEYSGRKVEGNVSYYAKQFEGKKMANGEPFNPRDDIAASKVLPLGTVAKITNTINGRTATVRIEDRGPNVGGRVVDVSPKVGRRSRNQA